MICNALWWQGEELQWCFAEVASSQRTTSRGRKASSWRKTSSPTAPPMGVALSKETTSSWVRPFRSTPFTWTGDTIIGLNSTLSCMDYYLGLFLKRWNTQISYLHLLAVTEKQQHFTFLSKRQMVRFLIWLVDQLVALALVQTKFENEKNMRIKGLKVLVE